MNNFVLLNLECEKLNLRRINLSTFDYQTKDFNLRSKVYNKMAKINLVNVILNTLQIK